MQPESRVPAFQHDSTSIPANRVIPVQHRPLIRGGGLETAELEERHLDAKRRSDASPRRPLTDGQWYEVSSPVTDSYARTTDNRETLVTPLPRPIGDTNR